MSTPRHISPNIRDFRMRKRKQFEKKKKKLVSIPDQFLYDVYGFNPGKGSTLNYKEYSYIYPI